MARLHPPFVPDDTTLSIGVKLAFLRACRARANAIDVVTRNGVVHLRGFVLSERDLVRAYKAARSVAGIQWIDNNVRVLRVTDRARRALHANGAPSAQRTY